MECSGAHPEPFVLAANVAIGAKPAVFVSANVGGRYKMAEISDDHSKERAVGPGVREESPKVTIRE
jgi:hypothetical protein